MEIRKYRLGDEKILSCLIKSAIIKVNAENYSEDTIKMHYMRYTEKKIIFHAKSTSIYVGIEGSKIIGTAGIRRNWISGVFVDPRHQGKGVGRQLIDFLESDAKKMHYNLTKLECSREAMGYYSKLGYRKMKVRFDPVMDKIIMMAKCLNILGHMEFTSKKIYFLFRSGIKF